MTMPLFASGPIRTLTGLSLGACLGLALPVSAALVWPFWPALIGGAPAHQARPAALAGAMGLAATVTFLLLYNRWFAGLPVIVDGDSGTHLQLRNEFVATDPTAYSGFVTFYALTYWVDRLVHHAFVSFAVCFYAAALVYAVAPLCAASVALESRATDPAAWRRGLLASLGCSLLLSCLLAIPLFHYHQAEGFFVHVFAIVPLLLIWLVDAMVRPPRLRLLLLGAGAAAYRYTYGLNLGDLLLALAALVVLDARAYSRARGAMLVFAALATALVAAAIRCYQLLYPLFELNGWITQPELHTLLIAQWLWVLALLTAACACRRGGCGLVRWLRLPIAFGTVNAAFVTRMLLHPPSQTYYLAKYDLHALWLLIAATPVLAAVLAAERTRGAASFWRARVFPVAVIVLLVAAAASSYRAIAPYRPSFVERAFGRPRFSQLRPVADLGAWSRIARVLTSEHKQFGGYLTTFYPLMNFMNAAFGFHNGGIHFYMGRSPREEPGYCRFWESGPPSTWVEVDFPQRGRRQAYDRNPDRQCEQYPAPWDPSILRTICWVCR